MDENLNSLNFWEELGVKYTKNIESNVCEFYKLYQKVLRDYSGFPENRDECINLLMQKTLEGTDFFLATYLIHLETKIKTPQLSIIDEKDLNVADLERYSRLLIRRLDKLNSEKRIFFRPQSFSIPFYETGMNKIWYLIKKHVGRGRKHAKNKRIYKKYNEELIILTKKNGVWNLRTSFKTMKEKRVIKKIFSSRKIVICKEKNINFILRKILRKYPILEISGFFYKDQIKTLYRLESEESAINLLAQDELKFLLDNEKELSNITKIKFKLYKKIIFLKIIPHEFNVKHIKLITTGITSNKLAELSAILRKELDLENDIYISNSKDKITRKKFILNSENIDEINIGILEHDLTELKNKYKLINLMFKDAYKICHNNICFHCENRDTLRLDLSDCPNCEEKLTKLGSSVTVKRSFPNYSKYIISALRNSGFEFVKEIEKNFKKRSIKLLKFLYKSKEFFVFLQYKQENLSALIDFFENKNYPVLIILYKSGIGQKIDSSSLIIKKICFPDLFAEYEEKKCVELASFVHDLHTKQQSNKVKLLTKSKDKLNSFISEKFDGTKLDGKSIQQKGNSFETLTSHILKGISKNWIELGQNHQNKSLPDGLGYLAFGKNSYTYGFDAKLKLSPNSRGLSSVERKKQKQYIDYFKKQSRGYGGLKCWIILIKSKDDYCKFKNSIEKLKTESEFRHIKLLGLEPLMKICEFYDISRKDEIINKDLFDEFLFKLFKYKGNITEEKINKILSKQNPEFKIFETKI